LFVAIRYAFIVRDEVGIFVMSVCPFVCHKLVAY